MTHHQAMSVKPKLLATEKSLGEDLATFEKLPVKTKELMKLEELDEKTTGLDQVAITRQIKNKDGSKKS